MSSKIYHFIKRYWHLPVYTAFIAVYIVLFLPGLAEALVFPDLLIAPIMAFGSFVAGSTFLGGGAVAFPAMTKILMAPPLVAKQFSLAIQSVGMVSASIFIIRKLPDTPWRIYAFYFPGALVGMLLSLMLFQHQLAGADIKVGFTLFIMCFYVIFVYAKRNHSGGEHLDIGNHERWIFVIAGVIGGALSGLIGSGADLILFCLLNLYFRVEFKRATLLSVIAMAGTSLLGIGLIAIIEGVEPSVVRLWTVAAPVVILGAPVGAWACLRLRESVLFWFVTVLVFCEIISTLLLVNLDIAKIKYFIILTALSFIVFQRLLRQASLRFGNRAELEL